MKLKLRDYQKPDPIWKFYRDRKGDGKTYNALVVLPTGAGKSLIIAAIIQDMLEKFGGRRVLVLTHSKELISQNHEKMMAIYPECEPGIYSASLGRKETNNKVLFCGIQSVYDKAHKLGDFSLIVVDECHLIPKAGTGMYLRFIKEINDICGKVPVIGLTATPFRLDSGYLHKGKDALFHDIAYEVKINDLLDQGYLCPLTTKKTGFTIDVSGVKKRGGEFIEADLAKAVDPVTEDALLDAIPRAEGRKSILVFCVTVAHAEHVSEFLNQHGITCDVVSGTTPKAVRDRLLINFKAGKIHALASVNVLSIGFDAPNVDCIIMLRPTQSPGLYIQQCGRGARLFDGKYNCLILDYAGNINRHGPIDAVNVKEPGKKGEEGEAPIKACPECESIVHASVRECPDCGFQFPPPVLKIANIASNKAILTREYEPEWRTVDRVTYSRHQGKDGKLDTMRVDYWDDSQLFPVKIASEFVCVFHPVGFAREKAKSWFIKRTLVDYRDMDFSSFVFLLSEDKHYLSDTIYFDLIKPSRILLDTRGKYATIVDYDFNTDSVHPEIHGAVPTTRTTTGTSMAASSI